ncbi:MAG: hypothetical protein JO112_10720, partial [Planctomycetes bacterium]|nr:hypothetical protein [Planctomycetota bacterium]
MSTTENETRIALVRRKQKRAQRWFRFFLLLMPLGFGIPLALAFTLPEGPWLKYLGMTALGLPILGLAGTLLMLGDRSRYRRSLMVAQAGQELGLEFYEKAPKEIQAWL